MAGTLLQGISIGRAEGILSTFAAPTEAGDVGVFLDGQDLTSLAALDLINGIRGKTPGFVSPLYFLNDTGAAVSIVPGVDVTAYGPATIDAGGLVEYRFEVTSETETAWIVIPISGSPLAGQKTFCVFPASGGTLGSSSVAYLAGTGAVFVAHDGTGQADDSGWNFTVPADYISGGSFSMVYTSQTGAGTSWRTEWNVTSVSNGGDFATVGSAGNVLTGSPVAAVYDRAESGSFTPAGVTFAAGKSVAVRVRRDPGHASDTFNGTLYVWAVCFTYEGRWP